MASIDTALGRIGIIERGGGPGTPILFLHGVGSDKTVWQRQIDHFGASRRAIAIDYPGYGDSDVRPDATRDDYAAAAWAVLDAMGVEQAHICGLSLGGVVAIAMHEQAAHRCRSLVIADSFAVHPDGQAIYDRSVAASQTMSMGELAAARTPALLGKAASDALSAEIVATMAAIDPAAFRIGAAAVWLADQRGRAARIRVPTLILVGDEDHVTPPSLSEELARLIPASRLEILNGAGHLANVEQPNLFNEAVARHLSGTDRIY